MFFDIVTCPITVIIIGFQVAVENVGDVFWDTRVFGSNTISTWNNRMHRGHTTHRIVLA